jgi:hypothetical protein
MRTIEKQRSTFLSELTCVLLTFEPVSVPVPTPAPTLTSVPFFVFILSMAVFLYYKGSHYFFTFVHIQLGLKRPEYVLRDITPKNLASSNSVSISSLIKLYLML